jgi:hypothetical protein
MSLAGVILASATGAFAADPDFGPNVLILEPGAPDAGGKVDAIYKKQERNQFGRERNAILLKPGNHDFKLMVGYNTQVAGLGMLPDDVSVSSFEVNARWFGGNATQNFWRGVENFTINRNAQWAVSQATFFRRMHVKGNLRLADGGWSSGGFIADSKIDGTVSSESQQQWYSRNTEWGGWNGGNWNMVFHGVNKPPGARNNTTVIDKVPVLREKPYMAYVDGKFVIVVSELVKDTTGTSWNRKTKNIPITDFHIAKEKDSVASMNEALAAGKHLLITPGIYETEETIKVTKPNTIVFGMGYATLHPQAGQIALSVADVPGVTISGILIEAGKKNSPALLEIGPKGSKEDHSANPTCTYDVFTRSGGLGPGVADVFVMVNSNNVICDHFWLWRGDHGPGAGWTTNPNKNGLVVNGNDVTCYGLFVEHTQEYQVLWNGERGRTYFYQCEFPYDPPNQGAWMSHDGKKRGWAAYKVADNVKTHEAWGMGMYTFFHNKGIVVDSAIECPETPGVKFHNVCTFHGGGSAAAIINNRKGGGGNPTRIWGE